jgi:hypothetical protein
MKSHREEEWDNESVQRYVDLLSLSLASLGFWSRTSADITAPSKSQLLALDVMD